MAFLMSAIEVAAPGGMWEWFIFKVFGFVVNYGWGIVLFTALLKLVLSPLDFYQKYKMRKNQHITEQLKPQMDRLGKQYADDPAMLRRKQSELQKKAGFSFLSSCLPLILTMVIFITFYTALRHVSSYMEFKQYVEMHNAYVGAYQTTGFDYKTRVNGSGDYKISLSGEEIENGDFAEIDNYLSGVFASDESLNKAIEDSVVKMGELSYNTFGANAFESLIKYKTDYIDQGKSYKDYLAFTAALNREGEDTDTTKLELKEFNVAMSELMQLYAQGFTTGAYKANRTGFLWIKSLWVADVPWKDAIPDYSTFKNSMSSDGYLDIAVNKGKVYEDDDTLFKDLAKEETYARVTAQVRADEALNDTNGYLVLAVLVVGLSVLSQFITNRQQKKSGQIMENTGMGTMKAMMFVMPVMLAVFALTSNSAFSLYMIVSSVASLLINLITSLIVGAIDKNGKSKTQVIKHGRRDPNDMIK